MRIQASHLASKSLGVVCVLRCALTEAKILTRFKASGIHLFLLIIQWRKKSKQLYKSLDRGCKTAVFLHPNSPFTHHDNAGNIGFYPSQAQNVHMFSLHHVRANTLFLTSLLYPIYPETSWDADRYCLPIMFFLFHCPFQHSYHVRFMVVSPLR